jgi:hypothetical protein
LFSGAMVRALLAGQKSQTRRAVKPQPVSVGYQPLISFNRGVAEWSFGREDVDARGLRWWRCPYGAPGDRLWVREAFTVVPASAYRMSEGIQQTVNPDDPDVAAIYAAGWDRSIPKWRPSIHMPRWASRLTLQVTDVRVERLQDISGADAFDEGIRFTLERREDGGGKSGWGIEGEVQGNTPEHGYSLLWDRINGAGSWQANPWVWAVSFKVTHA